MMTIQMKTNYVTRGKTIVGLDDQIALILPCIDICFVPIWLNSNYFFVMSLKIKYDDCKNQNDSIVMNIWSKIYVKSALFIFPTIFFQTQIIFFELTLLDSRYYESIYVQAFNRNDIWFWWLIETTQGQYFGSNLWT